MWNVSLSRLIGKKETIARSNRVSKEHDCSFAFIKHGLAITKIAKKVQNEEAKEFRDVFIMFGGFLIERAYFLLLVS